MTDAPKTSQRDLCALTFLAATDAMNEVGPETSDEVLAGIVADYIITNGNNQVFHLNILHDVRQSTLDRARKHGDLYRGDPVGPCPVSYDQCYRNTVRISTHDAVRARDWIIAAALAGYSVFRSPKRREGGSGPGSLASVRERAARLMCNK